MSKSLGNSPDLLQMIEDNGADNVRFSVLITSPAGNDLLFDDAQLEQGRFFSNKMWNAMKLVTGWEARQQQGLDDSKVQFALDWMDARLAEVALEVADMMADFRLSEALKTIYSLIWNDFCSWYLEWVKPAAMDAPISSNVYERTVTTFERLLQLLHPFMPFITEEIYHILRTRAEGDDLMVKQLPAYTQPNADILKAGTQLQEIITAVRDTRNKNQLKPKDVIKLAVDTSNQSFYTLVLDILQRQVNADSITFTSEIQTGIQVVVGTDKLYMDAPNATIDTAAQQAQMQKDLEYYRGFLASVEKKLNNEKFVANAKPDVIAAERTKQADAQSKIKTLEESLGV